MGEISWSQPIYTEGWDLHDSRLSFPNSVAWIRYPYSEYYVTPWSRMAVVGKLQFPPGLNIDEKKAYVEAQYLITKI